MMIFRKVAILGAGLLGASLGGALKKFGAAQTVDVWSRSKSTRDKCAAKPWCDNVSETPALCVQDADLVVLCATISAIEEHMKLISSAVKPGSIITDVGSTKAWLCKAGENVFKNSGGIFVGSHPMAGSDKSGPDYADADLFVGRPCFIAVKSGADAKTLEAAGKLKMLWESVGSVVRIVDPRLHDRIVARISHLPHILAANLSALTGEQKDSADLAFAASSGFKDTTRVAGGNPEIWKSIISTNKDEIVCALSDYAEKLGQFIEALKVSDFEKTTAVLEAGRLFRNSLDSQER